MYQAKKGNEYVNHQKPPRIFLHHCFCLHSKKKKKKKKAYLKHFFNGVGWLSVNRKAILFRINGTNLISAELVGHLLLPVLKCLQRDKIRNSKKKKKTFIIVITLTRLDVSHSKEPSG
jgi:hypothetical protein